MNKLKVPQLRFPGFDGEWKFKKIGNIAELTSSKRVYLTDYVEQGIPFYRGKEISELKLGKIPNDILYITESSYQEFKEKFGVPQKDDLLITAVGTLGNVLRIKDEAKFYFKDGNLIWFRKITEFSPFLEIALDFYKSEIEKTSIGSTQRALTMVELRKLKFPFPTLPEQQKIASFLSAVDEKIQQLSRKKELLEHYKKGVMQQLFSGKLRFKDESGNEYPDWEEKRLGDFKNLVHGDGDWILSENIDAGEKYSIIQLGNIGFGKFINKPMKTLSEKNFKVIKGTLIENGDLLINRMVDVNLNACVFKFTGLYVTSVDVCWIRAGSNINNVFFSNLILTEKYQKKLLSLSSGSGRVRISKKNFFDKFYFELPCLEEQQKIANFLSSIDAKIENTIGELEKVQLFKKGLLQKMFV